MSDDTKDGEDKFTGEMKMMIMTPSGMKEVESKDLPEALRGSLQSVAEAMQKSGMVDKLAAQAAKPTATPLTTMLDRIMASLGVPPVPGSAPAGASIPPTGKTPEQSSSPAFGNPLLGDVERQRACNELVKRMLTKVREQPLDENHALAIAKYGCLTMLKSSAHLIGESGNYQLAMSLLGGLEQLGDTFNQALSDLKAGKDPLAESPVAKVSVLRPRP